MEEPILITEYNTSWPEAFEQERLQILKALGPLVERVDHVGSTAVPGLPAKPVIDLLATVETLGNPEVFEEALAPLGYTGLLVNGEPPERLFLYRGSPRSHHLHIVRRGSLEQRRHLAFRDYLRRHPEIVQEYGALKHHLAKQFQGDRAGYTNAKAAFINFVEALAGNPGADSYRCRLEGTGLPGSTGRPLLDLRLVKALREIGSLTFDCDPDKQVQQYHFVDATSEGEMRRWLWVQFEWCQPGAPRLLVPEPELEETIWLGDQEFWQAPGEIDLDENLRHAPGSDEARALRYLRSQGIDLGGEICYHRFIHTFGPDQRQALLIVFAEPSDEDDDAEELLDRAVSSFTLLPGLTA